MERAIWIAIMPTPPAPMMTISSPGAVSPTFFRGAVSGQARAGVSRRKRAGNFSAIEQIARMRHQHMVGKSSRGDNAKRTARRAKLFFAAQAARAFAAADPGKHDALFADGHTLGIGAQRDDFAVNFMTQHLAGSADFKPLAMAKIKHSVVQVNIRMANSTGECLQQHFGALWNGRFRSPLASRAHPKLQFPRISSQSSNSNSGFIGIPGKRGPQMRGFANGSICAAAPTRGPGQSHGFMLASGPIPQSCHRFPPIP